MKIDFNILPFEFKTETVVVSLSKSKKKNTDAPLKKEDAPRSIIDLFAGAGELYTSFENESSREIANVEVNLNESRHFGLHYARHIVRSAAHSYGAIVSQNFIRDVDIYFPLKNNQSSQFTECLAATIKFQDRRVSDNFEMVVSYDGEKRIAKTPVASLPSTARGTYTHVVYNGVKFRINDDDADFWKDLSNTFPILTPELESVLQIPPMKRPAPFENKYLRFTKCIGQVYTWITKQQCITNILTFPENGFHKASEAEVYTVPDSAFELTFGGGVVTKDIVSGFKQNGPFKAGKRDLRLIFMYQDNPDCKAARDKYEQFLLKGLMLPRRYGGGMYPAIEPLSKAIGQLAYSDPSDDIVFSNLSAAPQEVKFQLQQKLASYGDPNNCLVIYVSPISKDSVDDPDFDTAYGRLKELFVEVGIPVQGIYAERAKSDSVQYSFTNIQAAICAKTQGIPWLITNACQDDLIFGVGAYRPQGKGKKYLGSAFAFNGTGVMKGFSCFQDNTPRELEANLKNAIIGFIDDCKTAPRRIIIHFYKKMSKKEWEPIHKMLKNGLVKDIPVVVVTITMSDSNDMMAYDTSCIDLMPLAGTYLRVGRNSFLLFNNSKYNQAEWEASKKRKIHHFPIKISMECRNSNILDNPTVVQDIIVQIFQLSRMYWKSVDQQAIPITVKYPAIMAKFLPLFRDEMIPNQSFGCKTLWFL